MKVLLAGFNVDTETLKELTKKNYRDLTPETISAAYARISRSPLAVDQLRKVARTEIAQARKSNRTIIFEMGHHSVAEHAVFNIDIIGISRLVVEEIERFRLCSFTEKSQRYVKMEGSFHIPSEIRRRPLLDDYQRLINSQNACYRYLYDRLRREITQKHQTLTAAQLKLQENIAKEDARYILPLATQTQLGLTINGRNLELLLRRFASHPLSEVRALGEAIFQTVKKVAPSIIIFYQACDYESRTACDLYEDAKWFGKDISKKRPDDVTLIDYTQEGDERILAALLHRIGRHSYPVCLQHVKKMTTAEKINLLKKTLRHLQLYDALPREFEYSGLTFELVVSASCFAQLKRHRMVTMTSQPYEPELGVMIPETIGRVGEQDRFLDVIHATNLFYQKIRRLDPLLAQYVLTNAHRRRVLISVDLRELYHMSRLREDAAAQWDVRNVVHKMVEQTRVIMPITTFLIGGKDEYPNIYKKSFGYRPKVIRPKLPGVKKF